jgi:hypothetical protein
LVLISKGTVGVEHASLSALLWLIRYSIGSGVGNSGEATS